MKWDVQIKKVNRWIEKQKDRYGDFIRILNIFNMYVLIFMRY